MEDKAIQSKSAVPVSRGGQIVLNFEFNYRGSSSSGGCGVVSTASSINHDQYIHWTSRDLIIDGGSVFPIKIITLK